MGNIWQYIEIYWKYMGIYGDVFQYMGNLDETGVSTSGGTPIAGCFKRENPIEMYDLGVPPCMKTPISTIYFYSSMFCQAT